MADNMNGDTGAEQTEAERSEPPPAWVEVWDEWSSYLHDEDWWLRKTAVKRFGDVSIYLAKLRRPGSTGLFDC